MSMFSYGTRAVCARRIAESIAESTSPLLASTPSRSRYACASASGSVSSDTSVLGRREPDAGRDEHCAGHALERAPHARPPQHVPSARDGDGIAGEPGEGQQAEDEPEREQGGKAGARGREL